MLIMSGMGNALTDAAAAAAKSVAAADRLKTVAQAPEADRSAAYDAWRASTKAAEDAKTAAWKAEHPDEGGIFGSGSFLGDNWKWLAAGAVAVGGFFWWRSR